MGLILVSLKIGIVSLIGAILVACGAVVYTMFPGILKAAILEKMKLVNGSDTFKAWEAASIPIYMQFFIFNVTNPEGVIKRREKPILQQVGPYTFREYRQKENVLFDNNDTTVSYEQRKWYVYDPLEEEVGSLEDIVTIPNIPLISLSQKTEGKLGFMQKMFVNSFITRYKSGLFVNEKVGDVLFDGYEDELMINLAKKMGREILKNGRFGFFYGQNYTDDGRYEVFTGVNNTELAKISTWNSNSTLEYWKDEYCDMINGSDGSMFKQFLQKTDTIYLFSTDLCRSLYMTFDYDTNVHGVKTYRFSPPFSLLADRTINPDNGCFCGKGVKECVLSGMLNISSCKKGAPIVVSPPHFYQSDTSYLEAVEGLNPNKFEHDTILDIEPITGVVLRAARRLQMNVAVRPVTHINVLNKAPHMIFPVLWVNESAYLTPERAEILKSKLYTPIMIGEALTYGFFGLGAFLLLCALLCFVSCVTKRKDTKKYGVGKVLRVPAEKDVHLQHNSYMTQNLLDKPGQATNHNHYHA